jgi:hypothetical protein
MKTMTPLITILFSLWISIGAVAQPATIAEARDQILGDEWDGPAAIVKYLKANNIDECYFLKEADEKSLSHSIFALRFVLVANETRCPAESARLVKRFIASKDNEILAAVVSLAAKLPAGAKGEVRADIARLKLSSKDPDVLAAIGRYYTN